MNPMSITDTPTVTVALGPVVGPLGRVALGGRNWEGFGTFFNMHAPSPAYIAY